MVLHSPMKPPSASSSSLKRQSDFYETVNNGSEAKKSRSDSNSPDISAMLLALAAKLDKLDEDVKNVNSKLNKLDLLDRLAITVESHDSQIQVLTNTVSKLEKANESLSAELCRLNLIYHGIPECDDESPKSLVAKINELNQTNDVDTAWRLGKFTKNSCRPVKVRFISLSARDEAFHNKKHLSPPTYVNPDLPKSVRQTHAALRKMKSEAISEGKRAEIMWKQQLIKIDGVLFEPKVPETEYVKMSTVSDSKSSSTSSLCNSKETLKPRSFLGMRQLISHRT